MHVAEKCSAANRLGVDGGYATGNPRGVRAGGRAPKVGGAYTYNWRVALASAPTVYVQTPQTTAARRTFGGLTPGETYIVQLNAVGTAGESNWSGISSLMVI